MSNVTFEMINTAPSITKDDTVIFKTHQKGEVKGYLIVVLGDAPAYEVKKTVRKLSLLQRVTENTYSVKCDSFSVDFTCKFKTSSGFSFLYRTTLRCKCTHPEKYAQSTAQGKDALEDFLYQLRDQCSNVAKNHEDSNIPILRDHVITSYPHQIAATYFAVEEVLSERVKKQNETYSLVLYSEDAERQEPGVTFTTKDGVKTRVKITLYLDRDKDYQLSKFNDDICLHLQRQAKKILLSELSESWLENHVKEFIATYKLPVVLESLNLDKENRKSTSCNIYWKKDFRHHRLLSFEIGIDVLHFGSSFSEISLSEKLKHFLNDRTENISPQELDKDQIKTWVRNFLEKHPGLKLGSTGVLVTSDPYHKKGSISISETFDGVEHPFLVTGHIHYYIHNAQELDIYTDGARDTAIEELFTTFVKTAIKEGSTTNEACLAAIKNSCRRRWPHEEVDVTNTELVIENVLRKIVTGHGPEVLRKTLEQNLEFRGRHIEKLKIRIDNIDNQIALLEVNLEDEDADDKIETLERRRAKLMKEIEETHKESKYPSQYLLNEHNPNQIATNKGTAQISEVSSAPQYVNSTNEQGGLSFYWENDRLHTVVPGGQDGEYVYSLFAKSQGKKTRIKKQDTCEPQLSFSRRDITKNLEKKEIFGQDVQLQMRVEYNDGDDELESQWISLD